MTRSFTAALAVALLALPATAIQPDASFLANEKKHAAAWAAEDAGIQERLAGLEKRFGKKPNIIYILADDVC